MKKLIIKALKKFKKGEQGYTTAIIAIILPIFIGLISFGVDWNYSSVAKTRYATVGVEALSTKPIHKNTSSLDMLDWLKDGYDAAGLKYSDIQVTESNKGDEFRIKVKFGYNSIFANINSDMSVSTFSYKHSGKIVSNAWCDWTIVPGEIEKSYCDQIPFLPLVLNENSFTENAYRYENRFAETSNNLTHDYKLTTNQYNVRRKARGKVWKLNTNITNATLYTGNDLRTIEFARLLESPALRSDASTNDYDQYKDIEAYAVLNTPGDNNNWATFSNNYTNTSGVFNMNALTTRMPYVQNAVGKIRPLPTNGYGSDLNGSGVSDTEWQKTDEYDTKVLVHSNSGNQSTSTNGSHNGFYIRTNNSIVTNDTNLSRTVRAFPRALRARADDVYDQESNFTSGGINTACTDLESALTNTTFNDNKDVSEYLKVVTQEMMYCNTIYAVHAGYAFPVSNTFNNVSGITGQPPVAARINSLRYIFVPRQSALGGSFPLDTTSDFEYYNIDPFVKYYATL